jgi:hypothetical protein
LQWVTPRILKRVGHFFKVKTIGYDIRYARNPILTLRATLLTFKKEPPAQQHNPPFYLARGRQYPYEI